MSATSEQLARAAQAVREGRHMDAEASYLRVLATEPDNAEALRGLGALEFQTGRYDSAERRARRLSVLRPGDPAIRFGLGLVLHQLGRVDEAVQAYQSALAINPSHTGALIALGELYRAHGRFDDAVALARQAVGIDPTNGEAGNLLGSALQGQGHAQEAVHWFETAARQKPNDARVRYNLGVTLQSLKRTDGALQAYRQAVRLDPGLMEARNNLGLLLVDLDKGAEAIVHLQVAVDLAPQSAVAHNNLGRALYEVGRCQDALIQFERALQLDPSYAQAVANMGAVQRALGQPAAALASLDRALALKPDLADAHGNRSMVLRDLGRLDEAAESAGRAIVARSDEAEFHLTLALAQSDRGFQREALESCRRAMALKPGSATLHRRLLGLLLYNPELTSAERFAEARRFGARVARPPPAAIFADRVWDPARRLRIGYVSSDLRGDHPVARNLRPIFLHHDRSRFEIFGYAEVTAPDRTTAGFEQHVDGWRWTSGIGDEDLARTIRDDGIDVLVILAGRIDQNRPLVAAYRAAPVQISFHDPATSGLSDMDYLIADRVLAPPQGTERFTERVLRLPHFYVHDPLDTAPPVKRLPLLSGGGAVTFGCFNNPAKLSDDCLMLWARLLKEIPRSRLLLKFRNWYQSAVLRRRIAAAFERGGISVDRLTIIETDRPGVHHLDMYNEVDVALDPLPFTGSTTTFEALWMGVPVITLAGASMISRWTTSILHAAQLERLVAATPDAYIAAAVDLVSTPERLAALRAGLRARIAASPLCDGQGRTRQLERLYRTVWRRACASRGSRAPALNSV